ncbi:synaptonemal complex central element protein 1-like isoform X2 [Centruroides vittatus]|uniref:synaptonemal complex central element protein 1-like isoform X2 n=1 Tax=Centruroides vittatus TaxID=120091 RepID=UPI00350F34C1
MEISQNFRVDKIKSNIEELSRVKQNLEKEVQISYTARRNLEMQVERETFKVAKFKAEQMDNLCESENNRNQELRRRIDEIKQKLKEEQNSQIENLSNFEEKLDSLTKKFINSISYYRDSSLEQEIVETEKKLEQNLKRVENVEKKISDVVSEIENFNEETISDEGVPFEQRNIIWKQFKEEVKASRAALQRIQEKLYNIKNTVH